ncbi:Mlo-related protein [Macleaya cordata]|uniref:MLO-like protein n=1 Tax=Macleaya cordata TaxID=56857 RepID=A0A200QKP2_MACCD|nr:Mlo-related protein [Macleaya cordata]
MAEEEVVARSLEETPTWAVAVVSFVLIGTSLIIEHSLHLLSKFFSRKRKSLNQALYKIKSELMLFGFISLLLSVGQGPISKICIPKSVGDNFLPCKEQTIPSDIVEESTCQDKGKISLVSKTGVDELQILIFTLALFHVLSCVLTSALGMAKMKRWESWEDETRTLDYLVSNDPRRFILAHQTSFAKRRLKCWGDHPLLLWPVSFIRQFIGSVSKTDYFILRHGFITAHFAEANHFDFQKFLRRALDEDFQVVLTWFIYFTLYYAGFYDYLWMPFLPLVMLLIVGTKLQVVITKMGVESRNESTVVRGTLLVKPNDDLFWFGRPQLLLHLVHCILFQNSFQLAFFAWTWYKFGFRSCFHRENEDIAIRISMGVLVQLLCGYVTLPLYALVTQMGSSMKKAVFTDRVIVGLHNWHMTAKRNVAASNSSVVTNSNKSSRVPSPSYHMVDSPASLFDETDQLEIANFDGSSVPVEPADIRQYPATAANNEIMEEEEVYSNVKKRAIYNGEVSFGWS